MKINTILYIHFVLFTFNGSLKKNDGPCGTFHLLTDHSNDIDHYTPLTIHVVSNNSNSSINNNNSPFGTLLPIKDHYTDASASVWRYI